MTPATADPSGETSLPIRKRPKPIQRVLIAVLGLAVVAGVFSVVSNENFGWPIVFEYFTSPRILSGLVRTLHLTGLSMAIGIVLGVILALMYMSRNRFIQSIAWAYIWFFRGTPVFVQLLFWGSISALYPKLIVGLPFGGPTWLEMSANDLITPYIAAVLGLGLNEAAYMAEIVRAGIKSVDRGQSEAATALGMTDGLTTRRVVLPQAMRVIIPPTGNQLIGMLKTSSLVAVLAYPELLYSAQLIYAVNYQTIPLLITASLWYLLITSVLSVGQYYLERHFGRSEAQSSLEAR